MFDQNTQCSCSTVQKKKYFHKISGPIYDRFDLVLEMAPLKQEDFKEENPRSSEDMKKKVLQARNRQKKLNTYLTPQDIKTTCNLKPEAKKLLNDALQTLHLSGRRYIKTIKTARTIADLDNSVSIETKHIAEALNYRGTCFKY
ncbi:ATP-binding protein [Candidatus Margulisiibacteriota bacterium]